MSYYLKISYNIIVVPLQEVIDQIYKLLLNAKVGRLSIVTVSKVWINANSQDSGFRKKHSCEAYLKRLSNFAYM